ncbi:ExeM/NucH family extracellular endonuclease [Microbulbifer halophilus]|uniref:ExeM/NucH family extracellular endonuclease n=1 Tax=Microbulbifer halophilus TaxID=453963 RepID=A0ABW5EIP5_9GAMM|nr:ExeM/NucH family extracellular endonuclease [Microbulbifer halophilus]MCW8126936.1 ExeM/NucH family extracellular endonuclease [Microbulbifer halophilus]
MNRFKWLSLPALCLSALASTHAMADLLISEYIEGSSNNKALEIYNGTGAPVDLADYAVQVYFNGSTSAGADIALSGGLADGGVFVLAHGSAAGEILAQADQTYGGGLFNGDDAVALVREGQPVDVIGQIGFDPGSLWGDATLGTQNQTLRRNGDILDGRSDGSGAFDPALEWTSAGRDNFDDLGRYRDSGDGGGNDDGGGDGGDIALGQCGDAATRISAVQGSGAASPLVGERVEVEAVVVADFRDTDSGLGGFFVQEEDADRDALETTSEGLFIYDNGFDAELQTGDLVRVGGEVTEYHGLTEINRVDGIRVCDSGLSVSAAEITMPFADAEVPERYEGMLAHFAQTLTVSGNYNLARYGELELSAGRLYTPTNIAEPGPAARAQQSENARNRILLDDGSTVQNPERIPYPAPGLDAGNSLRTGAAVDGLRGVITYGFGRYRVHPVEAPAFDDTNPRGAAPALPGEGSLRVASLNVLNYFNGDGNGGGFPTARGADTSEEFQRQRDKVIAAVRGTGADIVGLMEIENDGYGADSAIQDLVDGLNAAGSGVYSFVNPGLAELGTDQVAVGIIYRSDRVQPQGDAATLSGYPFDYGNRQPLLQSFTELATGESLAVVVNHLRSKGSCPDDGSLNDDQGDGQGCWNQVRIQAADALAGWVAGDPAGTGVERALLIGDLNSYARENPISTLKEAGYTDLLAQFAGDDAYSYVYDAQAGYLDHALASAELAPLVTGAATWSINADEPRALDYNTEYKSEAQVDSLYSADAYRASDHDPVVVELDLTGGNAAPDAAFDIQKHGLRIRFTDTSSDSDGNITGWHWDFGDGETSTERNPQHRYSQPGNYTVTLSVEDDEGAIATAARQLSVMDNGSAPQAKFSVRKFFGWVRVQHRGRGNASDRWSYQWDFGDGTTGNHRVAWHRYDERGRYQITLRVSDTGGREASSSRRVNVGGFWFWPFRR